MDSRADAHCRLSLDALSLAEATSPAWDHGEMLEWREELNRELSEELGSDIDISEFTRDLLSEVAGMPNGALVEVHDQDTDVWIGKRRGRFIVKVNADDANVTFRSRRARQNG